MGTQEVSLHGYVFLSTLSLLSLESRLCRLFQNQLHSQICNPSQRFKIFKIFIALKKKKISGLVCPAQPWSLIIIGECASIITGEHTIILSIVVAERIDSRLEQ